MKVWPRRRANVVGGQSLASVPRGLSTLLGRRRRRRSPAPRVARSTGPPAKRPCRPAPSWPTRGALQPGRHANVNEIFNLFRSIQFLFTPVRGFLLGGGRACGQTLVCRQPARPSASRALSIVAVVRSSVRSSVRPLVRPTVRLARLSSYQANWKTMNWAASGRAGGPVENRRTRARARVSAGRIKKASGAGLGTGSRGSGAPGWRKWHGIDYLCASARVLARLTCATPPPPPLQDGGGARHIWRPPQSQHKIDCAPSESGLRERAD